MACFVLEPGQSVGSTYQDFSGAFYARLGKGCLQYQVLLALLEHDESCNEYQVGEAARKVSRPSGKTVAFESLKFLSHLCTTRI